MINKSKQGIGIWFSSLYEDNNLKSLPSFSKQTNTIVLSIIILAFCFNFFLRINDYHNPHFDDYQYFYKVEAMEHKGGITHFIENYINGEIGYSWTALLTLILMPFFAKSYTFFTYANYVNLFFGVIMIFAVYFVGKKLFLNRSFIGLFAAFFISTNSVVLNQTSVVATENMLLLFSSLSVVFFIKGIDDMKYWLLAFVLGVLAYASKANGFIVIFASLLVMLIYWKKLQYKYISLVISLISITAILYTMQFLISSHSNIFLWKSANIYNSEYFGIVEHRGYYASILDFAMSAPLEFARRLSWGITQNLHKHGISLLFSVQWIYKELFTLSSGMLLFLFFLYLVKKDINWKRRSFFLIFSIILFISLIPRASVNHSNARYSIMLAPIFYFYLAPLIYKLIISIQRKYKVSLRTIIISVGIIFMSTYSIIFADNLSRFSLFPKFEISYQKSLDWLSENTKDGDIIALESNSRLRYSWYFKHKVKELVTGSTVKGKYIEDSKLINYFNKHNVKYVIIDRWAKHVLTKKATYFFYHNINEINKFLKRNNKAPYKGLQIAFITKPTSRIVILELKTD